MKYLIRTPFFILVILLFGCQGLACNSASVNNKSINIDNINLDTCKNVSVNFKEEIIWHKNFTYIGEIDTLHISEELYSVKTAKYIVESYESELCLNQLEILNKGHRIFLIDSVLTAGMYYYEAKQNLLAIPVILYQDPDSFTTESFIYIYDLNNAKCYKINDVLINSSFAFICPNSKSIIYTNSDKLMVYDLANNKNEIVVDFNNPLMSVFKLSLIDEKLNIYYFKDNGDDIINSVPLSKATISVDTISDILCRP